MKVYCLTVTGIPISEIRPPTTGKVEQKHKKSDLKDEKSEPTSNETKNGKTDPTQLPRKPAQITFIRSRMMYARAALNAKGGVRFGLRHIRTCNPKTTTYMYLTRPDVLNRFPNLSDDAQTVHIMKYIFPRQFDLHNVFTSKVDHRETAMPFKDYTLREKEIELALLKEKAKKGASIEQAEKWKTHLPKRLRGEVVDLVKKLRKLNSRCSYIEMLRHYCPVEVSPLS